MFLDKRFDRLLSLLTVRKVVIKNSRNVLYPTGGLVVAFCEAMILSLWKPKILHKCRNSVNPLSSVHIMSESQSTHRTALCVFRL